MVRMEMVYKHVQVGTKYMRLSSILLVNKIIY